MTLSYFKIAIIDTFQQVELSCISALALPTYTCFPRTSVLWFCASLLFLLCVLSTVLADAVGCLHQSPGPRLGGCRGSSRAFPEKHTESLQEVQLIAVQEH